MSFGRVYPEGNVSPDDEVVLWEEDFIQWDPTGNGWIDTGVGTDRVLSSESEAPGYITLTADNSASNASGTVRMDIDTIELGDHELEMLWRVSANGAYDGTNEKGWHFFGLNDSASSWGTDVLGVSQYSGVSTKWELRTEDNNVGAQTSLDPEVDLDGDELDRWRWWKILYLPEGGTVGTVRVSTGLKLASMEEVAVYAGPNIPTGNGRQLGPLAYTARLTDTGVAVRSLRIDYTKGVMRFRGGRSGL